MASETIDLGKVYHCEATDETYSCRVEVPGHIPRWCVNTIYDPTDDAPWNEESLSPRECGMVVLWKRSIDTTIHCYLPHRYMDQDLSKLVSAASLNTFENRPPYRSFSVNARTISDTRVTRQNFSVSGGEFPKLRKQLARYDWVFEEDRVNLQEHLSSIEEIRNEVMEIVEDIGYFRTRYCISGLDTSIDISESTVMEAMYIQLQEMEDSAVGVQSRRIGVGVVYDSLCGEADRGPDKLHASSAIADMNNDLAELAAGVDFTRLRRELESRYRTLGGVATEKRAVLASLKLDLATEIQSLRPHFPVLENLTVSPTGELSLSVGAVVITVGETSAQVVGDLRSLEVYKTRRFVAVPEKIQGNRRMRGVRQRHARAKREDTPE